MKLTVIGSDLRQKEIYRLLKNEIIFENYEIELINSGQDLQNRFLENVILPLPYSRDDLRVCGTDEYDPVYCYSILEKQPTNIIGGLIKKDYRDKAEKYGIKCYDYGKSESVVLLNAILTAEAALAVAVNETMGSIYGSETLVLGYGRIGKALCKYLKSLGADVTATSRDEDTLLKIKADGYEAVKTFKAFENADRFDYVFNTSPSPVLNRQFFAHTKRNAFVCDLATASGTDMVAAKQRGINFGIYGSLPAKYSPSTSADAVIKDIVQYFERGATNEQ